MWLGIYRLDMWERANFQGTSVNLGNYLASRIPGMGSFLNGLYIVFKV